MPSDSRHETGAGGAGGRANKNRVFPNGLHRRRCAHYYGRSGVLGWLRTRFEVGPDPQTSSHLPNLPRADGRRARGAAYRFKGRREMSIDCGNPKCPVCLSEKTWTEVERRRRERERKIREELYEREREHWFENFYNPALKGGAK